MLDNIIVKYLITIDEVNELTGLDIKNYVLIDTKDGTQYSLKN